MTDTLKDYLEKLTKMIRGSRMNNDFFYKSMEEFVLLNGQEFKPQPLNEEERIFVVGLIEQEYIDCKVKECFANSQKFATSNDKILYVEGFAKPENLIPVLHSWNIINGKVIDLTWCDDGDLIDKSESHWKKRKDNIILGDFKGEYFGVIIPTKLVRNRMIKTGTFSSLIDDWENRFPLLMKKWK